MEQFDPVQAWLDNVAYSHSDSETTRINYQWRLDVFCEFVGKTPQQMLDEYEEISDKQFRRKYAIYLKALISKLLREGSAPNSIRNQVSVVKSFFKYNDLPLGYVPTGRKKIIYHNRDIAKKEIQAILGASIPRDRAFYTMMAQSGQGPERLCLLRRKHIEPDFSKEVIPCKVEVPEEIAKGEFGAYFSFIGEESMRYLKAYLATRSEVGPEDYLFAAHGLDKRASPRSISTIFCRTVEKLRDKGIIEFTHEEKGKPRPIRLYSLRKFFRNHAGHAGVEYVNFWMGHKTDYKAPHIPSSDVHYFSREDVEFHRKLYSERAMPHLRLETATPSEMEQTIRELRDRIRELEDKQRLTDPLLRDIEALSRLPAGREFFSSIVKDAKAKLAEMIKQNVE